MSQDLHAKIALLLEAVDQSIQEQGEPSTPMAYFAGLMTLLERKDQGSDMLSSVAYLLDAVLPHAPTILLQSKFDDVAKLLAETLEKDQSNSSLVRSLTGCFESVLQAQTVGSWKDNSLVKRLLHILLILSVDSRPKPRKRAQDAIANLLLSPPAPTTHHPAALSVIHFIQRILKEHLEGASLKDRKQKEQNTFHILVLLKSCIHTLVSGGAPEKVHQRFGEMIQLILQLPVKSQGSGNSVLTQWVFQSLDALFATDNVTLDLKLVDATLRSLIELKPSQYDLVLLPTWLQLLANGLVVLSRNTQRQMEQDVEDGSQQSITYGEEAFPMLIAEFVATTISSTMSPENKPVIIEAAAASLATVIREAILNCMIEEALTRNKSAWHSIIGSLNGALTTMRYREAWGGVLDAVAAAFDRLARFDSSGVASSELLKKTLTILIGFRDDADYGSSFPFKKQLDDALDAAVRSMGLKSFTQIAPLHLQAEGGETPRGYLLHVFQRALSVQSTNEQGPNQLRYVLETLLPLANVMFEKSAAFWTNQKGLEAKLYETLGSQLWSLIPAVAATRPIDVEEHFALLAVTLGKILQKGVESIYPGLPSKVDLVPFVCETLVSLVNNNRTSQAINSLSARFLTTLCNCYTSIPGADEDSRKVDEEHERHRMYFEQAIRAFVKIAQPKDISKFFEDTVKTLLQMQVSDKVQLGKVYAMMDLLHILLPHLPPNSSKKSPLHLYYQVLAGQMRDEDVMLQKKTYRALGAVVGLMSDSTDGLLDSSRKDVLDVESLSNMLSDAEIAAQCGVAARKARVNCISTFVKHLAVEKKSDQHLFLKFVPSILSEIILATKDGSERARSNAYDTIVAIGYKMHSMGEETEREYLKMVAAGLIGTSQHMQSATITCMSRLLFEFRSAFSTQMIKDLLEVVLPFVESRSNEIAKSALGFVKVAIVSVEPEHLQEHLEDVVKSLLVQSRDKKSHFRVKVRHTLERLVRRFSYQVIEGFVPQEDHKFIVNIRKRRERASKKKSEAKEVTGKKSFDETMYGSESELDSASDDDMPEQLPRDAKSSNVEKTWIREDGDDPVDFMDARVVGKVLTSDKSMVNSRKRREPENDFPRGKDGRLIFKESDDEAQEDKPTGPDDYIQATQGEGAVKRLPGGKLAFARGSKRAKAEDFENPAELLDQELEAAADARDRKPSNKKRRVLDEEDPEVARMMGKQFKSKKAAGDVKRNGQDPFAYIPLSTKIMGNKRKTAKVSGQFKNILKAAKKGVDKARRQSRSKPQMKRFKK
jgi:ribosomal RNA-processing protein 12